MSFLQQTINATKESNKKYKLERAEYERVLSKQVPVRRVLHFHQE